MKVHALETVASSQLAGALKHFERQFTYPLGSGRSFRISHGDDYVRFFRAMGEARCFVAERDQRVLGVLGAALRPLMFPGGERRTVLYLGDLKVDPATQGGRMVMRLASALESWLDERTDIAFGVVMDGTRATPAQYTGRLGLPCFTALGKILVVRLCPGPRDEPYDAWEATEQDGEDCQERLASHGFACPVGAPSRSEMARRWLVDPAGAACGCLEDTLRSKRLYDAADGSEIRSAHLSGFAYRSPESGVALLEAALAGAAQHGLHRLFVAVPAGDATAFVSRFGDRVDAVAPATVFGTGFGQGPRWNINTSEI
ncbi:MAG: N-acetyltransferase [Gammaproteobacteria bacterium]|nr:N-acetyltransferase [Gammaproteobacteria bacterium]